MMRRLTIMGLFTFLTLVSSISISAQGLCAPIVANALALTEINCAGMLNNTACYGNSMVTTTFYDDLLNTTEWTPGSQNNISDIQLIESSVVSQDGAEWGISYFQVDPTDLVLPLNQAIRVLVFGDMIVENVPSVVAATGDFPATTGLNNTPSALMNNFYFIGNGDGPCLEAMNAIVVQPPPETEISLTVNSVPMRLSGTTVLGQTTGTTDNPMFVAAIDGDVMLYPNTERAMRVSGGEVSIAVLSSELDAESQPILQAQSGLPITDELGQPLLRRVPLTVFTTPLPLEPTGTDVWSLDYYQTLTQIPPALLNYPITVSVPPPSVTRVECTLDMSYNETWEVRNMPPDINQIIFFADFENAVPPRDTLNIVQNRPTQTVFGINNAGQRVEIQLRFEAPCPIPPSPTPLPTFTPLPTLTPFPTTVPIAVPTGAGTGFQSPSIIATPTDAFTTTDDPLSLTATAIIADLTSTAQPPVNAFELTATAFVTDLTATASGASSDSGGTTTHIVETGDTAFGIAQQYGIGLDELLDANGIDNPDRIFVGQQLIIP